MAVVVYTMNNAVKEEEIGRGRNDFFIPPSTAQANLTPLSAHR
jgi:hypothetical protein